MFKISTECFFEISIMLAKLEFILSTVLEKVGSPKISKTVFKALLSKFGAKTSSSLTNKKISYVRCGMLLTN